jgi:putative ABC transport system permease protein
MYKYFFKMAFRNLSKTLGHSILNIGGLVAGIIAFIAITLHVYSEFNYDNFHRNADRIYRCCTDLKYNTAENKMADSNGPLAEAIMNELPGAESVLRIYFSNNDMASYQSQSFIEENIMFADSNFFDFFDYELEVGNKQNVLNKPNSIVLTATAAKKYFGEESPIGKTLIICDEKIACEVTGIIKGVSKNSHLQFELLASFKTIEQYTYPNWGNWNGTYTYLTVKPNIDFDIFKKQYPEFQRKYYSQMINDAMGFTLDDFEAGGNHITPYLQPLSKIHLTSDLGNDINNTTNSKLLLMLALTGLLILLVACINFTNLSIARASHRAKEIGVKKVSGSKRGNIAIQLLSESFIQCILAVLFAIALFAILMPILNKFTGFNTEISDLKSLVIILILTVLPFILSIFAGGYPAFYLSSFSPVKILNGAKSQQGKGKTWVRGALVSFQFTTFIILIISAIFINKQVHFVKHHSTGYNQQNLIVINNTNQLSDNKDFFKNELEKSPYIMSSSYNDFFGGGGNPFSQIDSDQSYLMQRLSTDKDFAETFDIKIVDGRYFNETEEKGGNYVIISETAAKLIGLENVVGKYIRDYNGPTDRKVIGIFKDIQRYSFKLKQDPLVIIPNNGYNDLVVRVSSEKSHLAINTMKAKWESLNVAIPFDYTFLDDRMNKSYSNDEQLVSVLTSACILAIIIACIGLIGLVTFSANARQKEIGIRKVNGAKEFEIMQLLNGDYMQWVLIAFILACPIAWIIMNKWLENYAVKTSLSWWVFVLAGGAALFIAIATVSWISFKAARKNPIEALRYE